MAYSSNRTGAQVDAALDKADVALSSAAVNTLDKLNALILDATLLASSAFSTVALSGNYNDLDNKPAIPTALAQLDTVVTGAELNADHSKLGLIEPGATADQTGPELSATLTTTLGHSDWSKAVGIAAGTVAAGTDTRFLTTAQKTLLTGSGDTTLHYHAADRNRANHTGSQATSTVTGLDAALADKLSTSHTVTYNHALISTALQPGDAFPAADVAVVAAPTNYTAASADVAAHLAGIDDVLASVGGGTGTSIAPRTTVAIVSGAAAFALDKSAYVCQLSEDLTTITVPLPTGGNAATHDFLCVVDFTAPDAGGPYAVSIPTAWNQLGPLDAISLSAGDAPITVVVGTYADGSIKYTAAQGVPGA